MTAGTVRDARRAIERLSRADLDWKTFSHRALLEVTRVVGADSWCVASADPTTTLMTGVVADEPAGGSSRFFELEYGTPDFLLQSDLARSRSKAGALSSATRGKLHRSARWRELLEPSGLHDQLRGAMVNKAGCWGFFALARSRDSSNFSVGDVDAVRSLLPALTDGLRRSHLMKTYRDLDPVDSGLIVVDETLQVVEVSQTASRILGEAVELGTSPPAAVMAAASRARASGDFRAAAEAVKVRTPSGWMALRGIPLSAEDSKRVAVLIGRPSPMEVIDLTVRTHGMTRREAEVTTEVLRGLSTNEIAERLCLSPLTVQQHLKSIFDKLGVRSRREVVGAIFEQHFLPRFSED